MAISIGNVHLQKDQRSMLDKQALAAIEARTDLPLVIHGGSGVSTAQRQHLAANSAVCKFNIGTELRQTSARPCVKRSTVILTFSTASRC